MNTLIVAVILLAAAAAISPLCAEDIVDEEAIADQESMLHTGVFTVR